jgi:hypothetical protein
MTNENIIRMAREAGLYTKCEVHSAVPFDQLLKSFAALVAAASAAAERKECAAICDAIASAAEINEMSCGEDKLEFYSSRHLAADDCAELIRDRGRNEDC